MRDCITVISRSWFPTPDRDRYEEQAPEPKAVSNNNTGNIPNLKHILAFCALIILAELATVIVLIARLDDGNKDAVITIDMQAQESGNGTKYTPVSPYVPSSPSQSSPTIIINGVDHVVEQYVIPTFKPPHGDNVCAGKNPDLPNVDCIVDSMVNVGPQAGADVTEGYQGDMNVDHEPILTPYFENGMCPVNVHW